MAFPFFKRRRVPDVIGSDAPDAFYLGRYHDYETGRASSRVVALRDAIRHLVMQTIEEFKAKIAQFRGNHAPRELDDHELVFVYLKRLSPEQRCEALAQSGVFGDRLRRAWGLYLDWLERNRDYLFKQEEARRKRRIRYLLRQGCPIPEELRHNPYARTVQSPAPKPPQTSK